MQTLSLVSVPPSALVRSALADLPLRSRVRAPSPTAVGSAPPRSNHSPWFIHTAPTYCVCCWLCFLSRLGRLSASVGGRRARSVKHRPPLRPSPLGLPTLARSTKRRGNCGGGFTISASPGNDLFAPLLTCSVSSSELRYPPRPSSFQRGSWCCLPLASPSTARR